MILYDLYSVIALPIVSRSKISKVESNECNKKSNKS